MGCLFSFTEFCNYDKDEYKDKDKDEYEYFYLEPLVINGKSFDQYCTYYDYSPKYYNDILTNRNIRTTSD